MINKDEKKQLVKIAKMYYFEELTQAAIAKKIGVSRPLISKMLQKAKDEGIVKITIDDDTSDVTGLEQRIAKRFALTDAIVVPTENMNESFVLRALGRAAAQYVSRALRHVDKVGVSWGKSLFQMVSEYPIESREHLTVIPLVGGIGSQSVELHSNQIAFEWAKKLNGQCESLYAPAIVETEKQRANLLQLSEIAHVLEEGKKVDLAIVGIGNPYQLSTTYQAGYLATADMEELKQGAVVGDIGSHFICSNGELADVSLNRRVIGLGLADLKKIPKVVGVAAGQHKVKGILAALNGGYVDVLVTDDQTVSRLLSDEE
jgi:DNA-binding transcriptional regulator LsrR (DeoR family)